MGLKQVLEWLVDAAAWKRFVRPFCGTARPDVSYVRSGMYYEVAVTWPDQDMQLVFRSRWPEKTDQFNEVARKIIAEHYD